MEQHGDTANVVSASEPPPRLDDSASKESAQDSTKDSTKEGTTNEGSRARLQAMFDQHHRLVWRTLRRFGLDPATAADVGQQAYLVAVERIADIWPGRERAFLVGTALRLARKHRRNAARTQLEPDLEDRSQQPQRAESQAITLELLDRVLSQLDASLVEVFVLFDVEGLSTKEIAGALDVPTGTVASRLRRAREAFRAATRRLERMFEREEGGR